MVRIKWTYQSKQDLKEIANYISRDSKRYAKLQVQRIKKRVLVLKDHIRIGKMVPEYEKEEIRELLEGKYRIIYRIMSETHVDILTIHHGSRDLQRREIDIT